MTNVVNFLKESITDSSTYRPHGVVVSYTFQKEADPTQNIFELPAQFTHDQPITINDILANFPVKINEKAYHYRFLALCSTKDPSLKAWIDITNLNAKAPMINKTITMKILEIPKRSCSKIFGQAKEFQPQAQQQPPVSVQQPTVQRSQSDQASADRDHGQNGHRHHHHKQHGHQVHHPQHHTHLHHKKEQRNNVVSSSVTQTTSPSNEMNQNVRKSDVNNDFGGWDLPASGGNGQPFESEFIEEEVKITETKIRVEEDLFTFEGINRLSPPKANGSTPVQSAQPTQSVQPKQPVQSVQPSQPAPVKPAQPQAPKDLFEFEHEDAHVARQKFDPTFISKEQRAELDRKAQEKVDELRRIKEEEENEQKCRERAAAVYEARILRWAKKGTQRNNIRTLICNLHEVLWEGHTWNQVSIADLGTENEIKKLFQKAIRIVHPDKNQSRTIDQRYIADRVFYELNESFKGRT